MGKKKKKLTYIHTVKLEEIIGNIYGEEGLKKVMDIAFRHAYLESKILNILPSEREFNELCDGRRREYLISYYEESQKAITLMDDGHLEEYEFRIQSVSDEQLRLWLDSNYKQ